MPLLQRLNLANSQDIADDETDYQQHHRLDEDLPENTGRLHAQCEHQSDLADSLETAMTSVFTRPKDSARKMTTTQTSTKPSMTVNIVPR